MTEEKSIASVRIGRGTVGEHIAVMLAIEVALADARHDEAHAAQITPAVERSVVRVRNARSALEQTTRRRGAAQPARAELRRLLVRYRRAWKSLRALVAAWALCEGLDADTQANVKAAVATLSSGGVGVLSGTEANVWSVGRRRIDALIEAKLDTVFDGLGLGVALRHVMALHAELGRALGITVKLARKGASKPPSEGSAVRAARSALADYALKAQAMADDEVAGSRALVATLLAPLAALSGDAAKRKTAATKQTPATPQAPAQGTSPVARTTHAANDADALDATG